MKKSHPEDVRARRAQALRTSIATLSELLAELEQDALTDDAPQSAPDASLEALAHARREADSVYKVNRGLGAEIAELRTKNAVLEAHLVAVDASRPGLSVEAAQRWGEMVAAKLDKDVDYEAILAVEAMRLTRGITDAENAAAIVAAAEAPIGVPAHDDERETWITGIVEAAFAVDYETPPGGMSDAKTRLSAWIEQGIERGYIDADRGAYMRADLPEIQSPITDDAIDEAVAEAKADPLAGLPEEERRRILRHADLADGPFSRQRVIAIEVAAYRARQSAPETLTREEAEQQLRERHGWDDATIRIVLDDAQHRHGGRRPEIAAIIHAYVQWLDAKAAKQREGLDRLTRSLRGEAS